jgi:hypothetical protein
MFAKEMLPFVCVFNFTCPPATNLTRINFLVIHPRGVLDYNGDNRFSQTQQFVYSILTSQHVSALRAAIRLAKLEGKYTILNGV